MIDHADRLRSLAYQAVGPRVARVLAARDSRVAVVGSLGVVLSFAGACLAPALMLAWGPLCLGVPHLAADVRYLVIRPGFSARRGAWLAAAPALAATWIWPQMAVGLLAVLAALLSKRRWLAAGLAGLAALACRRIGYDADLAFAHLHNLIAVALFWAWTRRRGWAHFAPLLLFAAGAAALLAGAAGDRDLSDFLPGPTGLVAAFAFAQAVHYLVWLRLIPDEDRPRPTPRSFRGSLRALEKDLGLPLLIACAAGWLVIFGWGVVDADAARLGYLRASLLHGHLELVAVALLWSERRRPREATCC